MKPVCLIEGCTGIHYARGWCIKHYRRWAKHGDPMMVSMRPQGTGHIRESGYLIRTEAGKACMEHVRIAEAALGHALPSGACVHHVDINPSNNDPSNLVICPDHAYHMLLHQRQRAFDACGHYDWMPCHRCGHYDAPANMRTNGRQFHHVECDNLYHRQYNKLQRSKRQSS